MTHDDNQRFAPALPAVILLTVAIFICIMPRMLLAPLLLRIAADLGVTYDRASAAFFTASGGFVAGMLCSGFIARGLTHRWTITLALFMVGGSLIALAGARSELGFHLLVFAASWSNGLYPGSGLTAVSAAAPDRFRGAAIAIHEFGPNLAFIVAPILSAAVAPSLGWRGVVLIVGGAALVVAVIHTVAGSSGSGRGGPPSFRNISDLFRNRGFWVLSAFFAMALSCAGGVYGVLPTYLVVEHGLAERLVNNLVGASRVTGFAAIFTAGALADRFGFRQMVAIVLGFSAAATVLLGLARGGLLIVSVFLQPIAAGAFFPIGLRALTDVTTPERRNLAVALAIPIGYVIGNGLVPILLTAAGAAGHFGLSFVVLGTVVAMSIGLLPILGPKAR